MVYFDAQNRKATSSKGATYAIETEYIDSLKAIERWYSGPQKIKEVASFSNLKRRWRDGETTTYYPDGSVKRRTNYLDGKVKESFSFYPNHRLRIHSQVEKDSVSEQKCFTQNGSPVNCDTLIRQTKCPDGIPKPCTIYSVVRFPAKALKAGVQGKVMVAFVVDRFGKLVDTWIIESPSSLLNEAALTAVREMKAFCPGYVDCEPMDAFFTLPITFQIK